MKYTVSLKGNRSFRRMYAKGKSASSGTVVLYCRRNGLEENRVGITVSKKLGGAVVRNRARRRLREVCRLNAPALREGWDLVIVARGRCLSAPWDKLNDASRKACGELGLLREEQP